MIRPATAADLGGIEAIYDAILTREETGPVYTNWQKGKYPTRGRRWTQAPCMWAKRTAFSGAW